jgi:hypothetical protein
MSRSYRLEFLGLPSRIFPIVELFPRLPLRCFTSVRKLLS